MTKPICLLAPIRPCQPEGQKMIHYAIERDENGLPCRLVWSQAYQKAADEHERRRLERDAEQKRKAALPMPSMIAWSKQRGLTQ